MMAWIAGCRSCAAAWSNACLLRSAALALSFSLIAVLLAGCWDRTEINDLAIVLAAGIDSPGEGKDYLLSAQVFVPRQSSGGKAGGSSETTPGGVTVVKSATGSNLAEAMIRLQTKISRHVFWGHCETVVIGENAAKRGLRQYLDFLLRYAQFREHAYVYMSEPPAREILALLPPLERSSAEALREMGNLKLGAKVTILDLAKSIEGVGQSAVLSRLRILPPEQGRDKLATMPYMRGIALFRKDAYIRTVTEPISIGVLIMLNQLENYVFTVKLGDSKGFVAIKPLQIRTTMTPRIQKGVWSMHVQVETKGDIVLNTTDLALLAPDQVKAIERLWKEKMTGIIQASIDLAQKKLKTDFYGYAAAFRRHYPKQWNASRSRWESIYPDVETSLQVKVLIMRSGKSESPQGVPEDTIIRK
ncbi:Ger(x)C family spore germination protein [Paenibacillus oenotherae]|uniref:Ger(X)C family spore germination protein n=1 Tax=Paenibacillus oenotherae TaxID=1435645 RepID=A0ABS7DAV8_9BACL|nr:Ger(x)C family spore germination protein [Paenibacillus oenotherae]MBW7477062.1 Ger(x)C family spore germination protein [Paenibacillus oenotherae]